jgi:hypothetical protein
MDCKREKTKIRKKETMNERERERWDHTIQMCEQFHTVNTGAKPQFLAVHSTQI